MYKKIIFLAVSAFSFINLQAMPETASLLQPALSPSTIVVHNRVLAKVNGKFLSVMDVMKRMDMIFYQEYPHLASSIQARHQFYTINWRAILDDMIDGELIAADATEKKLVVSDGDVREELEELFGPNVVMTIDNFGLTFEEAWNMLLTDITVRRMTYAMVNNKALHKINPRDIRQAYEEFVVKNPKDAQWRYQVASFQSPDAEKSRLLAKIAHQLLLSNEATLETLRIKMEGQHALGENDQIVISEVYERTDKSLSEAHREILSTLSQGQYSAPVGQQSRNSQGMVYRIYSLQEYVKGGVIPFREAEEDLKNRLVQKAMEEESHLYRQQLRRKFRIDEAYLSEMIPEGFQPFTLV